MLHRVITTANGVHTGSSTFASVLHAAAGRAWLRTAPNVTTCNKPGRTRKHSIALAHCPSYSSKSGGNPTLVESSELSVKASPKSCAYPLREQPPAPAPAPTLQHNPNIKEFTALQPINKIRQQRKSATPPSVPQITQRTSPKQPPQTPTKSFRFSRAQPSAPRSSDHLACAPDWSPELAAECTSVTLNPPRRPELLHRLMPLAKSKEELYQNLLHLSIRSQTPPNLAQILDYHDCHSGMRSSSSYNLMLSLALRHSAYGTVHWLFSAMKAESIPYTMETYQHRARFLALLGRWDDVVKEFDLAPTGPNRLQGKVQIPPPIWLELLKARTDAVPGHKFLRKSGQDEGSSGITTEAAQQLAMTYESRFAFLMQNVPDIAMQNLSSNNPRVVAELVTALLRARHGPLALSLAQSYLRGLPSRLPERDAKACMGIIHPLVALLSTQKGLRKFVESRRILRTLLRSHHSLRPTSKTLLLVLSPLKHAKRCATVAANCIEEFVEKWGDAVIDRRVMLRLGSFAVKEGRMDLFNDVSESERLGSWQRPMWQLKGRLIGEAAIPPQDLLRPPTRKFLARKGREERKWCLLEGRARRKKRGEGEGKG